MSLRDNLDELDAALYDLLTSEPWAKNRASLLGMLSSDPATGVVTTSSGSLVRIADQIIPNRTVIHGHSRIKLIDISAALKYQSDYSVTTWMLAFSDQEINIVNDAAVGGTKVSQHLSSLNSTVLSYSPTDVFYMGLINSVMDTSVTTASMLSDLQTMFDAILASGARLHIISDYPAASGLSGWGLTASIKLVTCNNFCRNYAERHANCTFSDVYAAFVDPSTANGDAKSSLMFTDNLHANVVGGQTGGRVIWNAVKSQINARKRNLISSQIDFVMTNPASTNIVSNGLMQGSGGTGGVGGPVPTGWAAGVTGAGSTITSTNTVARADGVGNDAVIVGTFAAGAEGSLRYDFTIPNALVSLAGATYDLKMAAQLKNMSGVTKFEAYVLMLIDGVMWYSYPIMYSVRTFPQTDTGELFLGAKLTIPAGAACTQALIRARVYGQNGGAEMRIGRVSCLKI